MKRTLDVVVLVCLGSVFFFLSSTVSVTADPVIYFTDNASSTGPSSSLTVMEQALLSRLDGATESIEASIYGFDRESVQNALIDAHDRGVLVRIVTDDEAHNNAGYSPHFLALEAAGIPIVNDSRSSIMHNKFLIIDDQTVWTGSTNLTDNGFTYHQNNSLVFDSSVLADIYGIEFDQMFLNGLFGTAKTGSGSHSIIYDGSLVDIYFSPRDNALDRIITEVQSATESIYFCIFYFTEAALRDALIEKHQEGVLIKGIYDAFGADNYYSQDETLCNAGIEIKIENFSGFMHNKFMVIDADGEAPRLITGSLNWTGSGDSANDENTLIIHDDNVTSLYQQEFFDFYSYLGPTTLCQPASSTVQCTDVTINEIDSDTPGSDTAEFVEFHNATGAAVDLAAGDYVMVLYNGYYDTSYYAVDLSGVIPQDGFYVIGNAALTPIPDQIMPNGKMQNGADAVALYKGTGCSAGSFPFGTPAATVVGSCQLVDVIVYDTSDADDTGLLAALQADEQVNENEAGLAADQSIQRTIDSQGCSSLWSGNWHTGTPTPGSSNSSRSDDSWRYLELSSCRF